MARKIKISIPLENHFFNIKSEKVGNDIVYTISLDESSEIRIGDDRVINGRLTFPVVKDALKKMADEKDEDGKPLIRFQKHWAFPMKILAERRFIEPNKYTEFINMLMRVGVTKLPNNENLCKLMNNFSQKCPPFPNWTKGQLSDKDYQVGFLIAQRFSQLLYG